MFFWTAAGLTAVCLGQSAFICVTVLMKSYVSCDHIRIEYEQCVYTMVWFHGCCYFLQLWWDVQYYWHPNQLNEDLSNPHSVLFTRRSYCNLVIFVQPCVVTFLSRFTVPHVWGVFVEPSRFTLKTGTAVGQLTWPNAHSICWKDHGVSSPTWLLFDTLYL